MLFALCTPLSSWELGFGVAAQTLPPLGNGLLFDFFQLLDGIVDFV